MLQHFGQLLLFLNVLLNVIGYKWCVTSEFIKNSLQVFKILLEFLKAINLIKKSLGFTPH